MNESDIEKITNGWESDSSDRDKVLTVGVARQTSQGYDFRFQRNYSVHTWAAWPQGSRVGTHSGVRIYVCVFPCCFLLLIPTSYQVGVKLQMNTVFVILLCLLVVPSVTSLVRICESGVMNWQGKPKYYESPWLASFCWTRTDFCWRNEIC
jgi:hypothetical protein